MKVFIVLSCLVALGCAAPSLVAAPLAYHHAPIAYHAAPVYAAPVAVSSQYHAQDSIGQYNYGYADHLSSKAEAKSFDGVTRGAYSYVDAEGKVQKVEYTADDVHGFRVAATNLPVAPVAPEVPEVAPLEQPKPVEDTPEVAKAKEEHFVAVNEAKARIAAEAVAPVVSVAHYAAPVTTYAAAPVAHYAAPVTTYAAAPAHFGYSHAAYPHYAPYSNFGYHYSAAAPVYSAAAPVYSAYHPFHVASPFVHTVAAPEAVASDDDTVEVKAKEE
jgi:hypothetical protein